MREFIRRAFIIPAVEQPQKRRSSETVVTNIEREADQCIELVLAERNTNVCVDFVFRSADVLAEYRLCSHSADSIRPRFFSIGIGYRSPMELVPKPNGSVGSRSLRIVIWGGTESLYLLKRVDQVTAGAHAARPAEARESVDCRGASFYQFRLRNTVAALELADCAQSFAADATVDGEETIATPVLHCLHVEQALYDLYVFVPVHRPLFRVSH